MDAAAVVYAAAAAAEAQKAAALEALKAATGLSGRDFSVLFKPLSFGPKYRYRLRRFHPPAGVTIPNFVPGRGVLPRVRGAAWPPPVSEAEAIADAAADAYG